MAFPRRLLAEHEDLVLDLRPHWVALVWPVAQGVALAIVTVLAVVYTADLGRPWHWVPWAAFVAGVVLILATFVRGLVAWLTSHFVVTSDRVIHREGWFAKRSMEMPLERINDVKFNQSVFERMVGAGDLVIESGGEFGQNRFTDIRKPEDVQKTIYEMSERNNLRMANPQAPPAQAPQERPTESFEDAYRTTETVDADAVRPPSSVEQLERLADLRDRGVINEAEFQEEKARILREQPG
jgi:uncharacterized membrane protein YdbT with pleckstrin-like domain